MTFIQSMLGKKDQGFAKPRMIFKCNWVHCVHVDPR